MNNLKNKYRNTKLLFAIAAVFVLSACVTADFDEDINIMTNEINRLHNEDDSIKTKFTKDIAALRLELVNKMNDMDKLVSEKLAQKINSIQLQLNNEHDALHKLITDKSAELGVQISDWDTQLNTLITNKNTEFESSRAAMQQALEKAVADGDAALQAQITQGMQKLDRIQTVLPELAANTGKRMKALEDFEDKYENLIESIESLEENRENLETRIKEFNEDMKSEIDNYVLDFTSGEMLELTEQLEDISERMDDMAAIFNDYLFEINYFVDDASNFDGEMSRADEYISLMDDLVEALSNYEAIDVDAIYSDSEDLISGFDTIETLMDELSSYDLSDHIFAIQVYYGWLKDYVIDPMDDATSGCEGLISDVEECISFL